MIAWQLQKRTVTTVQDFDQGSLSVRETKIDSFNNGGTNTLGIGLDNLSGAVNLLFYF
jgi:hypothetical protein